MGAGSILTFGRETTALACPIDYFIAGTKKGPPLSDFLLHLWDYLLFFLTIFIFIALSGHDCDWSEEAGRE